MEELRNLVSLKDIVNKRFELYKNKVAFIQKNEKDNEWKEITYEKVQREINGLGTYMKNELKLSGKNIAVIGENSYKWYVTYMAVACGIGTIVPIDKELPEEIIKSLLIEADIEAIVFSNRKRETIKSIKKEIDKKLVYIEYNCDEPERGFYSWENIVNGGVAVVDSGDNSYQNIEIDPEEVCTLLYTARTTGETKGAMITHKNLCSDIYAGSCLVTNFGKYTCLSSLPMHHTYEFTLDYLFMTAVGGTVGIGRGYKNIENDLLEIKPDFIVTVPDFIYRMNKIIQRTIKVEGNPGKIKAVKGIAKVFNRIGIDIRNQVFSQIKDVFGGNLKYIFCGTDYLDPEVVPKLSAYGFTILQCYGMTECTTLIASESVKNNGTSTVGKAINNLEIRVDLSKNENENSNIGEIIVKGDSVMKGYYKDEERTKKAIKKGWFYTGDIGYFNLRGDLVILGRAANVIKNKEGKKVFPEELEHVLYKLPLIDNALVYAKKLKKNSSDIVITARVTIDKLELEERFGDDIPSDAKLYEIVQEEVKRINRMMVSYKAIKCLEIKKSNLVKTTTVKVVRDAEILNTTADDLITEDILKVEKNKKREKKKGIEVVARKK